MKNRLFISGLLAALLVIGFASKSSFGQTLVVCSGGNIELESQSGLSNSQTNLIIRNQNLIGEFLTKGIIGNGQLNARGEVVIPVSTMPSYGGVGGQLSGGFFGFTADGGGGYILTVRQMSGGALERVIANFHFMSDCQTFAQNI